jgi:hypothetical protein
MPRTLAIILRVLFIVWLLAAGFWFFQQMGNCRQPRPTELVRPESS